MHVPVIYDILAAFRILRYRKLGETDFHLFCSDACEHADACTYYVKSFSNVSAIHAALCYLIVVCKSLIVTQTCQRILSHLGRKNKGQLIMEIRVYSGMHVLIFSNK